MQDKTPEHSQRYSHFITNLFLHFTNITGCNLGVLPPFLMGLEFLAISIYFFEIVNVILFLILISAEILCAIK